MQVGRHADLRDGLAVLLCRRVHSALGVALEQWRQGAEASRRAKESELQRWREWAHVESYQRRRVASGVRHLLHRMRTRYLRASFETWCARGERNRRLESLLALGVGAQPLEMQRAAFRDWRCSMRWKCCSEWREDPALKRQQAAFELAAERLSSRLCNRGLSRVLLTWHATVREAARVAQLLQNIMARWNMGSVRGAFAVWKQLLNRRDKEDRSSAMQRLAVAKMNFRGMLSLGDCLRQWQRAVARQRRGRGVLSNCLVRMQHRLLSYAMNGWHDGIQSRKERKVRGSRAVARMLNAHMSGTFDAWRDTVKRGKARRVIGEKAVQRLLNNCLFAAFGAWHDTVKGDKARRAIGEKAVQRLLNNCLFAAFDAWSYTVKRDKARRDIGQRAVKRLQNNILYAVLDMWHKRAREQKARHTIGQRAVKRLKNNLLFAALDMWRVEIRSAKQRRVIGAKAVVRMRHGVMASALSAWRQGTASSRASAMMGARAIRKLKHAVLSAAMQGLRETVQRVKIHRKICTRALTRLFRVMLASAYHGWRESVAEKRRKWSVIQRAVQRLTQRLTASAFDRWLNSGYRQRKLRQSVHGIIMRLSNRTLANALAAWLQTTKVNRRTKATGERSVLRLLNRTTATAFECWWVTTVESRRQRKLCLRVLNRVHRRCTFCAFEMWAENVAAIMTVAAEQAREAAEQARERSTVDVAVLDSVVKEYDGAKKEWERRWDEMSTELTDAKRSVRTLRQQLEQTRARSTIAIKQASIGRTEEVTTELQNHAQVLEAERAKNSQLSDTIIALRAEMERLTSESATHVYIQSVCEDTLVQLMDGNERLRREKLALEEAVTS